MKKVILSCAAALVLVSLFSCKSKEQKAAEEALKAATEKMQSDISSLKESDDDDESDMEVEEAPAALVDEGNDDSYSSSGDEWKDLDDARREIQQGIDETKKELKQGMDEALSEMGF